MTRGIRQFVGRDWRSVRDAKDAYWDERIARLGPLEGFAIADQLRLQALAHDPEWPHPSDRREDLLAHVRLAEILRRASATRGR